MRPARTDEPVWISHSEIQSFLRCRCNWYLTYFAGTTDYVGAGSRVLRLVD